MNEQIAQIAAVLQELVHEHRQLIEYSKAKTEAIKQNGLESLTYIAGKEKKIIEQIGQLEGTRVLLIGRYMASQKVGGQHRSVKMEKLIQMVYQAEEKRQLQLLWKELSAAVAELQDINDFNQQLVRLNLEYLNFSQDVLLGPEDEDVTYHRAVQDAVRGRSGRFNIRT